MGPIDNIPALVQIMAWRRSGESRYLTNDDEFTDVYLRHFASMN